MEQDPQAYLNQITDFLGLPRLQLLPKQIRRVLTSEALTEPRYYYWTRGAILFAEWLREKRLDSIIASAKRRGAMRLFVGGGSSFPELSDQQRAGLHKLFRPEVEALEAVLNRDFSAWK